MFDLHLTPVCLLLTLLAVDHDVKLILGKAFTDEKIFFHFIKGNAIENNYLTSELIYSTLHYIDPEQLFAK